MVHALPQGLRVKVAFVGNCNTEEIMRAAKVALKDDPTFEPTFFWRHMATWEDHPARIAASDRIVYQAMDLEPEDAVKDLIKAAGSRVILAPYIAGSFLWPFATKEHPRNPESISPWMLAGAYEPQLSDAKLISLMEQMDGAPTHDIVSRFLDLDFNKITPLDRFYEFNRAKYSRLGESCGLNLWPLVESCMKDRRIFWTYAHPSDLLLWPMTRLVLEQLGASNEGLASARSAFGDPLSFVHTPVHPSVIRHFGINAISEQETYKYFSEGRYTAREYFTRFVDFKYDSDLAQTLQELHGGGKTAAVLPRLLQMVERQPENGDLHYHIAGAYQTLRRFQEAAASATRAVILEPDRPAFQALFRRLANQGAAQRAALPVLKMDQQFTFGALGGAAAAGLRSGWRSPESWGVWSAGGESRLNYALDGVSGGAAAVDVELELNIRPEGPHSDFDLEVWAEGELAGRFALSNGDPSDTVACVIAGCPVSRVNDDDLLNLRLRVADSALLASAVPDAGRFGLIAITVRRCAHPKRSARQGFLGLSLPGTRSRRAVI